jgi:GH25 family lysozyme M1 (1,4-beta-N-acetylmuramidase)
MKEIVNFADRVTPIWQRDPRWRDVPMGSRSRMTIGNNGCLMTAITMITNAMGRTNGLMPNDALKHFHQWRAVDPFSGMMPLNGLGITRAYPDALLYRGFITHPADIRAYLNKRMAVGVPVLVRVDTAAPTDHWVVIVGKRSGDYIAADPLYGDLVSVTGRYKNMILEVLDVRPVSYQSYPMAIDLSKYNVISFDGYKALKDRFAYAIVKASEGGNTDSMYSTHAANLSIPYSPYHYLRPESHTPIQKQLDTFRGVIDDFPRTHISWLDYEGNRPVPTATDLERFINSYEQAVGEPIGIYSTGNLLRSVPEKLLRGRRPIWQAHYGVQQPDPLPYSNMKPTLWQFYDLGRILGSDSKTDLNYVVGVLDSLLIRPKQMEKETIDLMPYIRPIGNSNGVPYMVQMADGRQERYQYQPHPSDGRCWYIVKNGQWEQWRVDQEGIVRLVRDTSPEPDGQIPCYYEVTAHDGTSGGMMFPARMAVGETYTEPNHHVVFRDKRTGAEYGDPRTGYNHNETTLFSCDGETIRIGKSGGEIHTYRKGMGRVGWESPWGTARLSMDDAGGYANVRETVA